MKDGYYEHACANILPIVPCCAFTPRELERNATLVGFEGNRAIVVDLSRL